MISGKNHPLHHVRPICGSLTSAVTGHPHLKTPNIDALAAQGALDRVNPPPPVCNASRMTFFTRRPMRPRAPNWNGFPARRRADTLGDHLGPGGACTGAG